MHLLDVGRRVGSVVSGASVLRPELSILVPVYNEVATVERLLNRVVEVPFGVDREIVVVDDGSTDGSRAVLARLASLGLIRYFQHERNRGKGAAVRTAVARARGRILVVQDADLELDPGDLPVLLEPILSGETALCYGTRFGGKVPAAFRRLPSYWANRVLNWLSNVINTIDISDFNTCYKMMTADAMAQIDLEAVGFSMEAEITAKVTRLGYRIVERPIRYTPRRTTDGKKIRFQDLFAYVVAMIRYRFFWSPGRQRVKKASSLRWPSPSVSVKAAV